MLIIFAILATGLILGFVLGARRYGLTSGIFAQNVKRGKGALFKRTEKRKEKIMERVRVQGRITNDEVEDLLNVSNNTALKYLNELEREGKLEQNGATGRGVYYTPKP